MENTEEDYALNMILGPEGSFLRNSLRAAYLMNMAGRRLSVGNDVEGDTTIATHDEGQLHHDPLPKEDN